MRYDPYVDANEATICISRFVRAALGDGFGIIWCDDQACTVLRQPDIDPDGIGFTVVVERLGTIAPPPPTKTPSFWQRLENDLKEAFEQSFQPEIQMAKMGVMAAQYTIKEGQKFADQISDYLDHHPTAEHWVGIGFDVVGILSFACLFVPGLGEGMLVLRAGAAAIKTGQYVAGAAKLAPLATSASAALGGLAGGWVDGKFLYLAQSDMGAATAWGNSPDAMRWSAISILLSLPDAAIGTTIALSDMRRMRASLKVEQISAQEAKTLADRKFDKVDRLIGDNPDDLTTLQKAARIERAAAKLADKARKADSMARELQNRLSVKLGFMTQGLAGLSVSEASFARGNSSLMSQTTAVGIRSVSNLLQPDAKPGSNTDRMPQNLSLRVAAVTRTPRNAR